MKLRRSLLRETVSVETYSGDGAYGPVYRAAADVYCAADQTRRLVRAADGREVVSELTLYVHPDDVASFTPESRIVYAAHEGVVITAAEKRVRGNLVHGEVACS